MELGEVVNLVQQSDLAQAEARHIAERDARLALRAQANPAALNTSELLRKLSTTKDEEPQKDGVLQTPAVKQEPSNEPPQQAKRPTFPAPPTGPAGR